MRLLVVLLVVVLYVGTEPEEVTAKGGFPWREQNCSASLHIPLYSSDGEDDISTSDPPPSESSEGIFNDDKCPPWFLMNSDNSRCHFSRSFQGRVTWVKSTLQTLVLQCYCMTNDSLTHQLAVSACPYTCLVNVGYYTLPCHASTIESFTCAQFKRRGLSCGDCAPGYAPPVYSYTSHCVRCSQDSVSVNWLKYLAVAFLPLTLFTLFVIFFQIKVTSPYLFSYVFFLQTMTMSVNMRLVQSLLEQKKINSGIVTKLGITLVSFWNLDFFQMFYDPFCLHPSMTTLMANFMDIFVALYPFVLIGVIAVFLRSGIGDTRVCAMLCVPINRLYQYFDSEWDLRSNLISAFATFILLSSEKILSVGFDMLLPAYVYPIDRHSPTSLHVFSSGNIEYFSGQHIPFALASIVVILALVILPMIVLLCYPLTGFRRLVLKRLNLDTDAMKLFVNHFHESYKNRLDDGAEYRWFPVLYFVLRIVIPFLFGAILSSFFFPIAGVVLTAFMVFLAVCRPRKYEVHNAIDIFHVMYYLIFILGIMSNITANSQTRRKEFLHTSVIIIILSSCLPFFYILGLAAYFVFYNLGLGRWMKTVLCSKLRERIWQRKNCNEDFDEYSSLLHVVHEDGYGAPAVTPKLPDYGSLSID